MPLTNAHWKPEQNRTANAGLEEVGLKRFIVVLLLSLVAAYGCSYPEIGRVLFGMSVEDVENAKVKHVKTFELEPSLCYDNVLKILKKMKARVGREKRKQGFIVAHGFDKVYEFCIGTTAVGILIKAAEGGKSEVEIASQNYALAKFVSAEIFEKLAPAKP